MSSIDVLPVWIVAVRMAVAAAAAGRVALVADAASCMVVRRCSARCRCSYNLRNLVVRWRTTLLTALAFTLVVGLLTVMLAFVNGMYRLTEGSGQPGNVMVLSDGATDELFSNLGYGDVSERRAAARACCATTTASRWRSREVYVRRQPADPVRKCPKCGDAAQAAVRCRCAASTTRRRSPARSHGAASSARHRGPGASAGPQPGAAGRRVVRQAGVQLQPARRAGDPGGARRGAGPRAGPRPGQGDAGGRRRLRARAAQVGRRRHHAVGRLDVRLGGLGQAQHRRRRCSARTTYTTVRAAHGRRREAAQTLAEDLTENFKKPAVQAPAGDGVLREAERDQPAVPGRDHRSWRSIMAIGGVFGVMNTMFAAISQRTKDIGVLRILGFAPLADPGVVLPGIAVAGADRRAARLRAGLAGATAGRRPASSAAARAAARASC